MRHINWALTLLVPLILMGVLSEAGVLLPHWISWPVFGIVLVAGIVLTILGWRALAATAADRSKRITATILYTGLALYVAFPFVIEFLGRAR